MKDTAQGPTIEQVFIATLQEAQLADKLYRHSNDITDLDRVVNAWQHFLSNPEFASAPERRRLSALNNTAGALLHRYWAVGSITDLDQALALWKQVISLTSLDSSNRADYLNNSGAGLRARYVHTGNLADLHNAIAAYQEALVLTPPGSPDREPRLNNLGNALSDRYTHFGQLADLQAAIVAYRQAATVPPTNSPDRAMLLNNLGDGLRNRYFRTGSLTDLQEAIAIWQEALELTTPNSPARASILNNLGAGLYDRYICIGDLADLQKAIAVHREVVAMTPGRSPARATRLNNLGAELRAYFSQSGNLANLQDAIAAWREAITLILPDSPQWSDYVNNLGVGLNDYYTHTGELANLQEAITIHQRALELIAPDSLGRAVHLTNLGNGLRARYLQVGDATDLDNAIRAYQLAVDLVPADSVTRASMLNNSGVALSERFARTGDLTDLHKSIMVYEQAVEVTPSNSPERAMRLNNLATGLSDRYARTGDLIDLQNAIANWQQVIVITPSNSPDLPMFLNNLGIGLRDRYSHVGAPTDLQDAIANWQQAATLTPPDSPDLAMYLNSLGNGLLAKYVHGGDLPDLQNAISAWQQSITITPANSPERVARLNNLGNGFLARYSLTKNLDDLHSAQHHWGQCCQLGMDVAPAVVMTASNNWGTSAALHANWSEAVQAYTYGVQTIEQLFRTQLWRTDKEIWLREAQSLPIRLAYAFACCGNSAAAITTLEHARTRLLVDVLERERNDLDLLPSLSHNNLHQRYQSIVGRITQLESAELRAERLPANFDLTAELRAAQAELEDVTEQIRQIPGYEDFFKAPTFEQIQSTLAAQNQVGVYLLTVQWGGLAFIVHAGGIREVWLESTEDELNGWLVKQLDGSVIGGYLVAQLGNASLETALDELLPMIGEKIIAPIVTALKELGISSVTLIPTGRMALFPLHAARYSVSAKERSLIDEFTVTYSPSAQALGYGQAVLANQRQQAPILLAIGNPLPSPEGIAALAFARSEVEEIESFFGQNVTTLYESLATRAAVEQGLSTSTYLHFSCHGYFDADKPLESGVLLSNGERLTVKDLIAGQRLKNARLAVLSACQTAITDFNKLPEEAVGLPSGFLQAGVPGVVGTLWPVNDLSTALLMIRFYNYHLKDGLAPAEALRKAQLWLRDVTNAELSELFDFYRQKAADRPASRMAYATAQVKFREHTLRDPDERPFEHSYYWAPFVFYGV